MHPVRRRSRSGLRIPVREGLERRPAGHSADARARRAHARVLRPRSRKAGREDPAALRRGDAVAHRRQCGDGGLQARIFSAGAAGDRSAGRGAIQPLRHAGDHASVHADADLQRPDRERGRLEFRPQRDGQLLPRERGDRPRGAAGAREYRRRDSRHRRHGDGRHAGKVHVLRRGERRRESVGAAARRAWVAARGDHGDRDRGGRSAQHQRSRKHHRRGHSHDDRRHHGESPVRTTPITTASR